LLPLEAYDLAYHPTFSNPSVICSCAFQNWINYYYYHESLTIGNYSTISQWNNLAWNWVLPLRLNPSVAIVFNQPDPMGYFVTTVTVTVTSNGHVVSVRYLHPIDWLGMGNLAVWYSFLLIVPVVIWKMIARKASELDVFIISWIIATYVPSLLLSAVVHRIVYPFYFVNVDPALALGIPMVVTFVASYDMKLQRFLLLFWLAAAILLFILFFPIHPLDL